MSQIPPDAFLISAQYGDVESASVIRPHFQALKAALKAELDAIQCEQLRQFAYVLRVGGAITQFNFEGCERIDLNRKKQYISIDVGVPIARWKNCSDREIAEYLAASMREGLEQMLARLRAEKFECDEAAIRGMVEQGMVRYLATWAGPHST